MLDNRALVDDMLTRRGVSAMDRERLCGDAAAVDMIATVIVRSINPDPIDRAVRDYWESQKASDPLDEDDDE